MKIIQKNPKNASAIIIHFKKKILLVLRSNHKKIFYPNHYGLFGGAKESNETFFEAAKREFYEETNICSSSNEIKYFIDFNFSFSGTKKIKRKFYIYEIKNIKTFTKSFVLKEGISVKFMTYEQIKQINNIVPYDKFAIDIFYSRNKEYIL